MYICGCVYMCVWRLGDVIVCLFQSLFTLSFEARSLPEFGVYWLARVLPLSPPTNTSWCHTCKQPQLTFNCEVRGFESKSVCFCGKHFTSWVISTVTVVLIFDKSFPFHGHLEKSLFLGLWWGRATWHKPWRVECSGSPQRKQEAERHERAKDPIYPSKCDLFFPTRPYVMKPHLLVLQLVAETPAHGPLGSFPEPNPNLYPDPESVAWIIPGENVAFWVIIEMKA